MASIRLFTRVNIRMLIQKSARQKSSITFRTNELFLSSMYSLMFVQMGYLIERFAAVGASKWFLTRVYSLMNFQVIFLLKRFIALRANE